MTWLFTLIDRLMSSLYPPNPRETPVKPPIPSVPPVNVPSSPSTPKLTPEAIYEAAKNNLGKHLTLDPNVPKEVGCCEAVSYVLRDAGCPVPKKGIQGVNALIEWLTANRFQEIDAPVIGAIVTAHKKDRNDPSYAHTGICGKAWIMSNDSSSGHFAANYSFSGWTSYFEVVHRAEVRYFIPAI